ncbi:MAG TPA: VWA domain-containing protein [Alphaproteobacteria bacterium]|nr:VWA domain-containing protein [Alphaproteobacteria bacterium]
MRILTIGMAFLALPGCLQPQSPVSTPQQSQATAATRKRANLVNVFFAVRDQHNALIPNLGKEDFAVLENGTPQIIESFSAETKLPLTLGIVMDTSGSMQRMLSEEKLVTADFLRQVISDKDLAFVLSFDISVDLLQDLTNDMRLLRSGLEKARINVGGGSSGIPGSGRGPVPISKPKGTLLFDAVYLASHDVLGEQLGRKAMVVLTDGVDVGSRLKLQDAIEAAQKADTICYVLLLTDPQYGSNSADMRILAEQTGGRVIEINRPDRIGDALRQISAELRSQYSLGYTPDNGRHDGTFRKIEIRAKGNYKVQVRKGYYAPAK